MLTVGGAISGYSAIGSAQLRDGADDQNDDRQDRGEDRPVDEEVREAHGRRSARISCSPTSGVGRLGLDLHARTHRRIGDAVDDDAIGGAEAAEHDAQALVHRPEHDGLGHDLVVCIEREDDLAGLIRDDGAIGDQDGIDVAAEELNARENAGREQLVLVVDRSRGREWCRCAGRAGCRRSPSARRASELFLVGEPHANGIVDVARGGAFAPDRLAR